jgi:hydrogenase nickel incorporation protein HypB
MCGQCGCGADTKVTLMTADGKDVIEHDHAHDHGDHHHHHGHDHAHSHDHAHHHHRHADGHHHSRTETVDLETRLLEKNDALAARNRAWLAGREILALNLVSSPGAGKTTLLERTIRDLRDELSIFVIEGDQETALDAKRIRDAGATALQVNTGTGCHLDAEMIARGLGVLKPPVGAVVLIENVGNLVCPALFDLGERAKVAVLSVTEGEDKPLKYPHMFRAAALMILNKIDLLPYVQFDLERAIAHAREVNPALEVLCLSATTGEGLGGWYDYIRRQAAAQHTALLGAT